MKKKRKGFIRSGEAIPVEEVIHLLKDASDTNQYMIMDGDPVKITSQRYPVFQRNLKCSNPGCSLVGSVFYKEKTHPSHKSFHLNLYAINKQGREVLMTKDHRIPKSKGGANSQSNYDTMCTHCNSKKGNKLN